MESNRFEALVKQMEAAKAKMVEEGKILFNEAVKDLFEAHSEMNSFSWNQYTPYFNDGDECVFEVYSGYADINGESGEDICEESCYNNRTYPAHHPELLPAQNAVAKLLRSAPNDMMKILFGDHRNVTVYRDGRTEIDECDHD